MCGDIEITVTLEGCKKGSTTNIGCNRLKKKACFVKPSLMMERFILMFRGGSVTNERMGRREVRRRCQASY